MHGNVVCVEIFLLMLLSLCMSCSKKKDSSRPINSEIEKSTNLGITETENGLPGIAGFTFSSEENCKGCQVKFRENDEGKVFADMIHWGDVGEIYAYQVPVTFDAANKVMSIGVIRNKESCHFQWEKVANSFNFSLKHCDSTAQYIKSLVFVGANQNFPDIPNDLEGIWIDLETKRALKIASLENTVSQEENAHNLKVNTYKNVSIYKYQTELIDGDATAAKLISSYVDTSSLRVKLIFYGLNTDPSKLSECYYYALDEKTLVAQSYNPSACLKSLVLKEEGVMPTAPIYTRADVLKLNGLTFKAPNNKCPVCDIRFRLQKGLLVMDLINWGAPGLVYAMGLPVSVDQERNTLKIGYLQGSCNYQFTPSTSASALKFTRTNCLVSNLLVPVIATGSMTPKAPTKSLLGYWVSPGTQWVASFFNVETSHVVSNGNNGLFAARSTESKLLELKKKKEKEDGYSLFTLGKITNLTLDSHTRSISLTLLTGGKTVVCPYYLVSATKMSKAKKPMPVGCQYDEYNKVVP